MIRDFVQVEIIRRYGLEMTTVSVAVCFREIPRVGPRLNQQLVTEVDRESPRRLASSGSDGNTNTSV